MFVRNAQGIIAVVEERPSLDRDRVARSELDAQRAEIGGLRLELGRKEEDLIAATQLAAALARRIEELERSASWKVTRPLRVIYDCVRRPSRRSTREVPQTAQRGRVGRHPLDGLTPISDVWGFDRGRPVDRHYIEGFLNSRRQDIRGRVLEVKDSRYARTFGTESVAQVDVLDIDSANQHATLLADLSVADFSIPTDRYDCFILTQTLHLIYDVRTALGNAFRLLMPGGVLLCTIPAVSRVNPEGGGLETGDHWRLTAAAVRRLFLEFVDNDSLTVETYGNVRTCAAFLYGLAAEELEAVELAHCDPWFPLIHCIRAVR
jgi:hypothetical protein